MSTLKFSFSEIDPGLEQVGARLPVRGTQRLRPNLKTFDKMISSQACNVNEELTISIKEQSYIEMGCRGRLPPREAVRIAAKAHQDRNRMDRLHFTSTTTYSDSIAQVHMADLSQLMLTKSMQVSTEAGPFPNGKPLPGDKMVVGFHNEKSVELLADTLHHVHASVAVVAPPALKNFGVAGLRRQIRMLLLAKTDEHAQQLEDVLTEWIVNESISNPRSEYYLDRKHLIKKPGLQMLRATTTLQETMTCMFIMVEKMGAMPT